MNARQLATSLAAILGAFTTPRGSSNEELDDLTEHGCKAGSRLGRAIRKIATIHNDPMRGMHTLEVTLKGGRAFVVEVQQLGGTT